MLIRVAIIEDERNYNYALKQVVDYDDKMACVGQFYSYHEAIENLEEAIPDVVLTDINLLEKSGIDIVTEMKPKMENTHFIMCTSFEDDESIFNSMKAGASGYLIKGEPMDKIIQSIHNAVRGGAPMSFGIAKRVLNYFREKEESTILKYLTPTENEVLEELAKGLQYKEIADKKFVTIDTIKKHIANIYRKLQVNNKVEAINKYNQSKK